MSCDKSKLKYVTPSSAAPVGRDPVSAHEHRAVSRWGMTNELLVL